VKYFVAFFFTLFIGLTLFISRTIPASAVSENIVIMQLQTAGAVTGTSSEEIIVLYNLSPVDVNISGWCMEYSSASNGLTFTKLACVEPLDDKTEIWVASGGYVSFATSEFILKNPSFVPDTTFSAGIAATGGHLRLVNSAKQEIDRVSWGNAVAFAGVLPATKHTDGKVLSRDPASLQLDTDLYLVDFSSKSLLNPIISGLYEVEILIDLCPNITGIQVDIPAGFLTDDIGDCYEDFCPNIDDLQLNMPDGYEKLLGSANCTLIPLEDAILFITELVANAKSSDTGQEYIELYNPNNRPISLLGYKIQVGPGFTKEYKLPDVVITPSSYMIFKDSQTSIVLPNTTGVQLRLVAPDGNKVNETAIYSDAGDDVSWALVEDQWIYTNQITPNAANKPYLEPAVIEVLGITSVQAPCPANKYRNPETNRCRNIETAVSQLTPCDEDEYRSTVTNRCRKTTLASSLSACAVGQERNPETNRCRKTSVLASSVDAIPTVTDVSVESTAGQINWLVISMALLGTFAYMAYEWRSELGQKISLVKSRFA